MALRPYRDEQLNYFKFASIVLDDFPKALRQTFKSMWDNTFGYLHGYQLWDDSITVRNMFLATEGGTTRVPTHHSYDEWDCTALFQATIYASSFALPDSSGHHRILGDLYVKPRRLLRGRFHPSVISPGGNKAETFALAIDQLRLLRNSLCHSPGSEIKKITFDQHLQIAKDAFKALGVNTNSIDAVGGLTESDFPTRKVRQLEEDIRMELMAVNKFLQDEVKDQLLDIKSDIVQSNQERQNDQKKTETERKEEIQDLKNQLKCDKDELKEKLEHITSVIAQSNQKQLEDRKETEKELDNLTSQLQFDKDELKEEMRKTAEKTIEATTVASRGLTENMAELKEKLDDIIISKKLDNKVVLPRSCLPPTTPHFTGRQNECDEIIGHVTSESTRLVSIWGSPGFGKTSVAIKVGHHLQSEGLPVYFLSLRGLRSKADLTSKLLSFLRQSSSNDPSSRPLSLDDELCELFSKIEDRCVFILDNADELFESGAENIKEDVVNLLEEILGRSERVIFILTTRESLEFMKYHFQGLQVVRIRPLDEHSSEHLVHGLLAPSATSSDCNRITQICGRVPLAIKLLCSSISEDYNAQPSQFLDEFMADKESNIIDMLDNPDYPNNLRLQFLFDSSFQRLPTQEKEALVSLSIIPENFNQDVAAAVLNLTRFSATKKLQSLRRKSLIDLSSKPGSFQIHSLLQSFAREKGEQEMKETVLISKARFYAFYISLFEKLNEQFLTGHSMSAFNEFYENKQCIIHSLTEGCAYSRTSDSVFDVLVKAELFVSSVFLTGGASMLYDSVIKAANNLETNVFYRQLMVSRALFEIPLGAAGATMQLLSKAKKLQALSASVNAGEEGKNLCYSGICHLVTGKTEQGVQVLKEALPLIKDIPNQTVLRLTVCQILAIYYRFKKDSSSFSQFYSKALQDCKAAGDTQLLVIPAMESTGEKTDQESMPQRSTDIMFNHPLLLQVILLVSMAAKNFSDFETKQFVSRTALEILKDNESAAPHSSLGLLHFQRNVVYVFYVLDKIEDAAKLSEASINYHQTALKQCSSDQEQCQRRTKHFPGNDTLHQESLAQSYWDLGNFQLVKANFSEAIQSLRSALDIQLKLFGDEHSSTADSYLSLGCAQHAHGDLASALQSTQRALYIRLKLFGEEHSSTAESYHLLGMIQRVQGDLASALQSSQCALNIRLKLFGEENSSTAESYVLLGDAQYAQDDFTSALQSAKLALDIRLKLFGEEHTSTADSYVLLGNAQHAQDDFTSALQSYQRALDIRLKLFGEEHSSTADSYHSLARTQSAQGDEASALQSYQRALDIRLKLFGEEHTSTADNYMLLGNAQHAQDDFTSALQSFQRALDIRLKLFGEEHSSTADSYNALGQTQFFQGDLTSALQSFKRALYIRRKLFGEEHSSTAYLYDYLGGTQHALGDLTSAFHSLQRALDIRRKLFGEEHSSTARSYHSLGMTQRKRGDFVSALQSFQRALDIRLKLFGEEHSSTADSYNALGQTQFFQGDLTSALQSFKRALYIRRKLFGEEHSSTAYLYDYLGGTQHALGDLTSAFHSLQRALDIRRKLFGEEHSSTACSYHSLGMTQRKRGDFVSALQSDQRALDIRLKLFGEEHSSTAESYHSLGLTQRAHGDLTSALQSFQRALDITLKLFGEEHSSTADLFESLGITQRAQGNLTSAVKSFQRALNIRLKLFGEEHSSTADLYESLGVSQRVQGDLTSALQSFQRALDIRLKLYGRENVSTADSYDLLAITQRAQGDLTSAVQSFQCALDIRLKLFGEGHLITADSYFSLGETQYKQDDLRSALSAKRALDIRLKLLGEEHSKTADSYHSVGATGYLQGNLTLALQSFQRALDIRIKLFGEEHSITARSYYSLGFTQHAQGDLTSALQSKQSALDIKRKLFGEEHPSTADSYSSLGDTQHAQGDLTSAFQSKQRALNIRMKLFLKKIAEAESHI